MSDRADDRRADPGDDQGHARHAHAGQDELSELVAPDTVDEDEQAEDDMFELDQQELDELGLTLDDPHQPGPE